MKKTVSIILIVGLILSLTSVAFAADETSDFNTVSYMNEIEQLKERMRNAGYFDEEYSMNGNERVLYPIIEQGILDVPLYQQINGYYCGPASAKMVIDYLEPQSVTQQQLGMDMSTMLSIGTTVPNLKDALNRYIDGYTYRHTRTSDISFRTGMMYSIDNNCPVVCQTMTGSLPNYGGVNKNHYIVTTGYLYIQYTANGVDDQRTIYYNDPINDSRYYGSYSCTETQMITAINNNSRYYIIGE